MIGKAYPIIVERGLRHAVIYSKGKLVHDPHPDGGDVRDIFAYWWVKEEERVNIS